MLSGEELDVFEASALGDEAQIRAILAADPACVHLLAPDGFQPLHLAAYFGHPAIVRALIKSGANVNAEAKNPSRVRPLHSAVTGRHQGAVEILLEAGAQPNAAQKKGWTALHAAAHQDNEPLVDLLLRHGADPHVGADNGDRPADMARQAGDRDLADRLEATGPA